MRWGLIVVIILAGVVVGLGMARKPVPVVEIQTDYLALSEGKLDEWVVRWQRMVPGFNLGQMRLAGTNEIGDEVTGQWPGEGSKEDQVFYVYGPGRKHLVNLQMEGMGSPDQDVAMVDLQQKKWWRIAFCGTPCSFDGAVWINDTVVVLTGYSEGSEMSKVGPTLSFYDLVSGKMTRYQGPEVDAEVFRQYLQE